MKKLTVILLIIMGVVILLGSVSNSWAGANKKVLFLFVLNFDEKGNVTGVDTLDRQTGALRSIEGRTDAIQDIVGSATLHWLKDDDPCVVIGGKRYCW
jgi:hypothetical protein